MSFWDHVAAEKHLLPYPESPWGPVGFLYPNQYSVGMASLGYQQVYRLFRMQGLSVERVFFDKKGRETRSVENQTPLFRFPLLAASYIYELDILNLVQMLLHGGVAPMAAERGDDAPLLLMGGTAASDNPALLARLADAIVLGEGEGVIPAIAAALQETGFGSKAKLLAKLAAIPHIYVPAIHGEYNAAQFTRYLLDPIDSVPCHTAILAPADEFSGAFLLELCRGCKYRCKFCVVHYMSGTARYRKMEDLLGVLEMYKDHYSKVGLLGAAVADHPQVTEVAEWVVRQGKQVSTSSLRAERLNGPLLDLLQQGGQKTITVAPEAGDLEIRRNLLKGVKDEKYFALAEEAGKRGFQQIKLYFLLGTPGADPMDEASAIIQFAETMGAIFSKNGGGKLVVACSPLVPKPTTPWADVPLWDAKQIKKASRVIRKKLAFQGNMKVPPINVKEAVLEALLSWAGPDAIDEILRLAHANESIEQGFEGVSLDSFRPGRG
ncbi:MAG: radical SAM protein [bacterium]|nr:radical SAM protein [bacterium]